MSLLPTVYVTDSEYFVGFSTSFHLLSSVIIIKWHNMIIGFTIACIEHFSRKKWIEIDLRWGWNKPGWVSLTSWFCFAIGVLVRERHKDCFIHWFCQQRTCFVLKCRQWAINSMSGRWWVMITLPLQQKVTCDCSPEGFSLPDNFYTHYFCPG